MRKLRFFTAMTMLVATAGLACAQTGLEGPLQAPDDTSHDATAKPTRKASHDKTGHDKARHKKVAHGDPTPPHDGSATNSSASQRDLALPSSGTAPADPLSFGMKWNGNNDDARETRTQNYNGTAAGSGAEVGMKLHF